MQLIDILHLVMAALLAATAIQRYKKQGESFFIRIGMSVWFLLTSVLILPVDVVRNTSTIWIIIMLLFEFTGPIMRKQWEKR